MAHYDVAVVGGGIIGLAHAYVAAVRGKKVIVLDRDAQSNGASIRNFGFVTITGQAAGDCWSKARRAREIWEDIANAAGINIVQRGMLLAARYGPAETIIDEFLKTDMGSECKKLTTNEAQKLVPSLRKEAGQLGLFSPHEIRVESREALPRLITFLSEKLGVVFQWNTYVHAVNAPSLSTSKGTINAEATVVCPGDDFTGLFADRLQKFDLSRCKLQMMRVTSQSNIKFKSTLLSELSLARSSGYQGLQGLSELQQQLNSEMFGQRSNDIHLIVAQSPDGSLVVGDSHHYSRTPDPFGSTEIEGYMLSEFGRVLDMPACSVSERWVGTYAWAPGRWRITDQPSDAVRLVVVTSGCGASTCFAIAEETIDDLFGSQAINK
ncbi:TIGR03364 family FAD-dependent oxidoreductase [Falsochrobactrum sp. TDYN1]|uniref:TIGR03364 family FAD-dependent oxidoreductase n=1 Tax=Falsochrobactrum tianjinense TaxID=2706015 RepID=A0A949PQL6_9HYPH|nr:TIGR03364 family FAD-dependent oxidoreductase [Falsochrobactrum sp. TDYN1]MBV2144444.1 TIGR03364 family FAD-dependent oxidoreductase [Falsochrobactrum sp. TDYN1]